MKSRRWSGNKAPAVARFSPDMRNFLHARATEMGVRRRRLERLDLVGIVFLRPSIVFSLLLACGNGAGESSSPDGSAANAGTVNAGATAGVSGVGGTPAGTGGIGPEAVGGSGTGGVGGVGGRSDAGGAGASGSDGAGDGGASGSDQAGGGDASGGDAGGGSGGSAAGQGGTGADGGLVDADSSVDAAEQPTDAQFQGDLTGMGPHSFTERAVSVSAQSGDLMASVYEPEDGPEAPFPLVIVLPGFLASYAFYAVYSEHMASWGFVVVGLDFTDAGNHPQSAQDVLDTIDWVESQDGWGVTDTGRVATAGHSAGGKIAYYAASLDPARIRAVVGWDPVNAAGPPCGVFGAPDDPNALCNANPVAPNPTAGQAGVMDAMTAAALTFAAPVSMFNPAEHHAEFFYQGSPSPAMYVYFPNGAHTNWGVVAATVEEGICKPMGVAWLLRHLKGMGGADIDVHLPPTTPDIAVESK